MAARFPARSAQRLPKNRYGSMRRLYHQVARKVETEELEEFEDIHKFAVGKF